MSNFIDQSVVYYPGYSQVQVHPNLLTRTIIGITKANPCVVTTSYPHHYVPGMRVTFLIPPPFGMQQLNNRVIQITSVRSTILTLNISSLNFTPFAYPSPLPSAYTPPSVIPYCSGPYLSPPPPLPYANETSFEGTIFNNGTFGNPVNGEA